MSVNSRCAALTADRLIGTPHGLQSSDELSFIKLQMDIDSWTSQLPTLWQYSIKLVLDQAPALMNLFIVTLEVSGGLGPIPLDDLLLTV